MITVWKVPEELALRSAILYYFLIKEFRRKKKFILICTLLTNLKDYSIRIFWFDLTHHKRCGWWKIAWCAARAPTLCRGSPYCRRQIVHFWHERVPHTPGSQSSRSRCGFLRCSAREREEWYRFLLLGNCPPQWLVSLEKFPTVFAPSKDINLLK